MPPATVFFRQLLTIGCFASPGQTALLRLAVVRLWNTIRLTCRPVRLSISIVSLVIALFYCMAALEMDPGNVGDDFGDVYDTHLPAQPVLDFTAPPLDVAPALVASDVPCHPHLFRVARLMPVYYCKTVTRPPPLNNSCLPSLPDAAPMSR